MTSTPMNENMIFLELEELFPHLVLYRIMNIVNNPEYLRLRKTASQ